MRSKTKQIVALTAGVVFAVVAVALTTAGLIPHALGSAGAALFGVVPLLVGFERGADEKKIVLLAVLISAAVVGRWAFAFLPNFTLSTGFVILAGVLLGARSGFAAGAVTVLVSNVLLGQGLWTPWQMMATGLIGIGAAALSRFDTPALTVYAVFAGFMYGVVLDVFSMFAMFDKPSVSAFLTVWGASFFFDLAHAVSSALTVIAFHRFLKKRIGRVLRQSPQSDV